MTDKELVILAAQFDLVTCRWSIASINAAGEVTPLVQSAANDLAPYSQGTFDERSSFLRHRIAGALQRGADRLWGRTQKAELFAVEFTVSDDDTDNELVARVAEHFCMWMVKPPVVCLRADGGQSLSVLAGHLESPHRSRVQAGLTVMRPLTAQQDLWETISTSSK